MEQRQSPSTSGGMQGSSRPPFDEDYWRERYTSEPYYLEGTSFDDYLPAYVTAYESVVVVADGRSFADAEHELREAYEQRRANSRLEWSQAKHAVEAGLKRFVERY